MSNSRDYYMLIYNQFYREKYDVVFKLEHRKDTEGDTLILNIRKEEDTTDINFLVKYINFKRDAFLCVYKMHIATLDEYLSLNSNWKQTTVKVYLHIIIDYICFSSTVDPIDFEKYLISKFKLNLSQIEGQVNLAPDALNYKKQY